MRRAEAFVVHVASLGITVCWVLTLCLQKVGLLVEHSLNTLQAAATKRLPCAHFVSVCVQKVRPLMEYLVARHWPAVAHITYVDTFQALKKKHDQLRVCIASGVCEEHIMHCMRL
jgi:hypothetical protein